MAHGLRVFVASTFLAPLVQGQACQNLTLDGPAFTDYYNTVPAHGGPNLAPVAAPWNKSTCCTDKYSQVLQNQGVEALYNWSWSLCYVNGSSTVAPISATCKQYLYWQEASYNCDPYMAYYQDPEYIGTGILKNVPLCQLYCDGWFEACKNDYTCVSDWVNGFSFVNSSYVCPGDSATQCRTFGEIYGNGRNLCNTMWSTTYVASSNDSACMSLWFWNGNNPNSWAAGPTPTATCTVVPRTSGASSVELSSAAVFAVLSAAAALLLAQ